MTDRGQITSSTPFHPDGGAAWIRVSSGQTLSNDDGFAWIALPADTYQLVPDRPNVIVNAKGKQFFAGANYQDPNREKRTEVSTVAKIQQERRERRERGTFERLYEEWDNAEKGEIGVFERTVRGYSQRHLSVLVHTHDSHEGEPMWSILGELNDVTWEDALAWLVDNRIGIEDVTWAQQ